MKSHSVKELNFIGSPKNANHFNYTSETGQAAVEGRLAPDITEEQQKVTQADLIIFQFPYFWMGFPAIMKGWVDRVFSHNFALRIPDRTFDDGMLKVSFGIGLQLCMDYY